MQGKRTLQRTSAPRTFALLLLAITAAGRSTRQAATIDHSQKPTTPRYAHDPQHYAGDDHLRPDRLCAVGVGRGIGPHQSSSTPVFSTGAVGQVANSLRQSAGRQAAALPHRHRRAGIWQPRYGDRGRLRRGAAARKGDGHRILQSVRRGEHGKYAPYLHTSDTAEQYSEGQIDPKGPGWEKNLREQFERRSVRGSTYIELDNPDAYAMEDVLGAIDLAPPTASRSSPRTRASWSGDKRRMSAIPMSLGSSWSAAPARPRKSTRFGARRASPSCRFGSSPSARAEAWAKSWRARRSTIAKHGRDVFEPGEYGNAIDILPPPRGLARSGPRVSSPRTLRWLSSYRDDAGAGPA